MSLGKVRGNKNPLASLGVQPQCFLTQMQLKSIPHDMTDSASLECSPTIFCPRMFHLFFFFFFCHLLSQVHMICAGHSTSSLLVQDISLVDLLDVEVTGFQ